LRETKTEVKKKGEGTCEENIEKMAISQEN
jgi:hypothetical protein